MGGFFYTTVPAIGVLLIAAAFFFALHERRKNERLSSILNDAIESFPSGFLFFNETDMLVHKNTAATKLIPDLHSNISLNFLDGFLDYIFRNLSKEAEPERAAPSVNGTKTIHAFQEIIETGGRTCLIQGTEFQTGETAIFISDISEVRKKEEKLSQTQKLEALGQLAGGVAHDFNNVLSIIDGYARMAENALPAGDEKIAGYLERIRLAGRRGAALTRQLLLFGRHKIAEDTLIDAGRFLKEQEKLLLPLLDSSITLSIEAEKGLFISCMPDGLAQIVMNLVVNARDAMPEGGRITIRAAMRDAGFMRMSIEDTGTGIDPAAVNRIFEPFFTTKGQGKGTGLGLSMAYGLVQDMKGAIDVESVPGEGTKMHISLPLKEGGPVKSVKTDTDGEGSVRFEGYTVLLAEDEPDLLHIMKDHLQNLGMEVIAASNGADALIKQDEFEGDIDFLLTDVVMPELSGVKLAELVQAVREEVKVIFMSGFPAEGNDARIKIPENALLLAKPVALEKLAFVMRSILDDGNAADEAGPRAGDMAIWRVSSKEA